MSFNLSFGLCCRSGFPVWRLVRFSATMAAVAVTVAVIVRREFLVDKFVAESSGFFCVSLPIWVQSWRIPSNRSLTPTFTTILFFSTTLFHFVPHTTPKPFTVNKFFCTGCGFLTSPSTRLGPHIQVVVWLAPDHNRLRLLDWCSVSEVI